MKPRGEGDGVPIVEKAKAVIGDDRFYGYFVLHETRNRCGKRGF